MNRLISSGFLDFLRILELRLLIVRIGFQAANHSLNSAQLDPGLTRGCLPFVILAQPTTAAVASVRLLHYPTYSYGLETLPLRLTFYLDLLYDLVSPHPLPERLVVVLVVGVDLLQPRELLRRQFPQHLR